jgi:hypothetical protein
MTPAEGLCWVFLGAFGNTSKVRFTLENKVFSDVFEFLSKHTVCLRRPTLYPVELRGRRKSVVFSAVDPWTK